MLDKRIIPATMVYGKCTLEKALQTIKGRGYNSVELTIEPNFVPHYDPFSADVAQREAFVDTVQASGMKVASINCGDDMVAMKIDMERSLRGHIEVLNLARMLGVEMVIVGAGVYPPSDCVYAERFDQLVAYHKDLAKRAGEEFGIQLLIEAPHRKTVAEKPEDIIRFWDAMQGAAKCNFDTSHATYAGGDAVELIHVLGRNVANVHLRDAVIGNSLLPYGQGNVDFAGVFQALREVGYSGNFVLELPGNTQTEGDQLLSLAEDYFADMHI